MIPLVQNLLFRSAALALSAASLATAAGAQSPDSARAGAFQPNLKPSIRAVRVTTPVKVDGELDDAAWQDATRAANFTQWNPSNLERPPVETEAMLAYDDDHLYVALIAYDDPKTVRANMRDRDQIYQDDFIGLFIDTMGDGSWAYEIWSNPLGVQGDILWTPTSEDERFDMVFSSKGKITERGYQVEMAIPFSSLRFPNKDVQTWRTTFWRNHPRSARGQYSWAAISRNEPCWQCQWGTMTGIEKVHGSGNIELLPYVAATQQSVLRNPSDLSSGLHNGDPDANAGFNLRYTFTSNMSAAAAVNPDFSQVESDAAQVDVNSTFALFYPEKRPFFQEGTDLIQTNIQAIYTRSINDPSVAGRFTGRANRSSFVAAVARDEHTPFLLPFEEESAVAQGQKSTTTLARFRQILGQESNVGLLLTDRRPDGGGSGTTYGADGTLRFLRNYRFEWQALGSHTLEPVSALMTADINAQLTDTTFDHDKHTAAFDGESFSGSAFYGGFRRDGKVWNAEALYHQYSPDFRADNGFVTQNNIRQATAWTGLDFRPKKNFFTLVTPNVSLGRVWNFDNIRKDEWVRPELYGQFKGQSEAWIAYLWSREQFHGKVFPGIKRFASYGSTRFCNPVVLSYQVQFGRFIARNLADPVLGRGATMEVWGTFKPIQRLAIEPDINYAVLHHPDDESRIFEGTIFRVRGQYQFTRELFLRLITQYDEFDGSLEIDPLVSYKLNPFTVAYLGSTHFYNDGDVSDHGFMPTQRQFFAKVQYLFKT